MNVKIRKPKGQQYISFKQWKILNKSIINLLYKGNKHQWIKLTFTFIKYSPSSCVLSSNLALLLGTGLRAGGSIALIFWKRSISNNSETWFWTPCRTTKSKKIKIDNVRDNLIHEYKFF